jgi:acyl-CoA hydrolase
MGRNAQAVLDALRGRVGLQVHCGLLTSEMVDLIESGEIDRTAPVVVGEAIGGAGLMDYIDGNEGLSFETSATVHHPGVLADHRRFVSINSVLEVDLLGRANCEFVDDRVVGGLGGLTDFLEAGVLSPEGHNVLVLPSDSRTGGVRLVGQLNSADTSVARSHVDYVVTEFGIADLRSTTPAETRMRLLEIADPETAARLTQSQ